MAMKRILLLLICFTAAATNAEAQSLTDLFKQLFGSSSTPQKEETTSNIPASVTGTWIYQEPVITYTGNDILASLAVATLRDQFTPYYAKAGLTPGHGSLLLNGNGTVHAELGDRKIDGTYRYDRTAGKLTFTGTIGKNSATLTGTVTIEGGMIVLLFDAQKTLEIARQMSSSVASDSRVQQIAAILKEYPGVMFGAKLKKQ